MGRFEHEILLRNGAQSLSSAVTSVRISVYVQPRASKTEVAGMHGDALKIRLTAPPVDNAANSALIEFIAGRLGIAKSSVRVASGATGRRKIVEIAGVTLDHVSAALR
jgi:uncharacterized protein